MADFKTCSTKESRKRYDDKAYLGKVWMYARYSSNDSCGEVNASDCPDNYKTVGNNTKALDREDSTQSHNYFDTITASTGDCVDGGNWEIVSRNMPSNPNIATDTGDYPGHTSDSVHDSYDCLSCWWPDDDNFTKVCYKDREGWKRTDPEDGERRTTSGNWERHKNICCGFNKQKRSVTSDKYCDYSYCWEPASGGGGGHDSRFDKVSSSCQAQLETLCRGWGGNDLIGYEDDICAYNRRQIVPKVRTMGTADAGEIHQASELSAQISYNSYRDNGKNLCNSTIFTNKGTAGSLDRKKFDKCSIWCKDFPDECGLVIPSTCSLIYNSHKAGSTTDGAGSLIDENEPLCACNWPEEYYQNIKDGIKEKYNVGDAQVTAKRECLVQACSDSAVKPANLEDRITEECDDQNFISCVQNIDANFADATVTGDTDIIIRAKQECGTLADTGAASGSGGDEEEEDAPPDDSKRRLIIVIIIILLLIASVTIIL